MKILKYTIEIKPYGSMYYPPKGVMVSDDVRAKLYSDIASYIRGLLQGIGEFVITEEVVNTINTPNKKE